jgi:hypothetical protein
MVRPSAAFIGQRRDGRQCGEVKHLAAGGSLILSIS